MWRTLLLCLRRNTKKGLGLLLNTIAYYRQRSVSAARYWPGPCVQKLGFVAGRPRSEGPARSLPFRGCSLANRGKHQRLRAFSELLAPV
jgi:hypothetical protein